MSGDVEVQEVVEPKLSDGDDCWPPLAHIFDRKAVGGRPVREGDLALCGAKLMGIDLDNMHCPRTCARCEEIWRRLRA